MRLSAFKQANGFIIADICLSLLILSVVVMALSSLFSQMIISSYCVETRTQAAYFAQEKLEELKEGLTEPSGQNNYVLNNKQYAVTWQKALIGEHDGTKLIKADVSVEWQVSTKKHLLAVSTYLVEGLAVSPQW